MPRKNDPDSRSRAGRSLKVALLEHERTVIDEAAALRGITPTTYIRQTALEAARTETQAAKSQASADAERAKKSKKSRKAKRRVRQ